MATGNEPSGSTNGVGPIARVNARMTNAQKARDDGMERLRIRNRKWLVRAMDQVMELDEAVEWTGEGTDEFLGHGAETRLRPRFPIGV